MTIRPNLTIDPAPEGIAVLRQSVPPGGVAWQPIEGPETHDLLQHVFPDEAAQSARRSVIDASAGILSRCTDPDGPAQADTGLVIGHVQSGQTLSFTTVSALARDNRFHMVIVMTGISIPLFEQSTRRIQRDLRLDTPKDRKWMMLKNPGTSDLRSLQDLLRDRRDDATPAEQKMTALITVMKNHNHLANLRDLLRTLDLMRSPILIIDDEADQASMNTKVNQSEESTTYQRIGEIRRACPHHTFIQYTATPQAPLLISLIDALSPNFVRVLDPGNGYVGGRELFIERHDSHIREIPDDELAVDPEDADAPPDSLLDALRVFMLGVAASYATSSANPSGHRSMLVHPSHRTAKHSVYTGWITRVKLQWEAILDRPGTAAAAELLDEFRGVYEDLQRTEPNVPSFDVLRRALPRAIRLTQVKEVNARRGRTPQIEWFNAYSWVLVAGQAVDRGFTVEGLTVTYMPRGVGVGNADTLQQRGRFFGYKRDYLGYCRIFLPSSVIAAFHSYVAHEEDVRSQLREYQAPGRSLNDWKRAFIMSPELRPTRQDVLRLDYMRGLLSNDWLYPAYPLARDDLLQANRTLVQEFLAKLTMHPDDGHPDRTTIQRHRIAQDVSLEAVLRDLLVPLKVPASTDAQRFTGLMLQLRRALERVPDEIGAVYLMSPGEVRKRGISDEGRIPNLFQGEYPVERSKRGSIYPGDRAIRAPNQVTVQVHMLTLTDRAGRPLVTQVPVVAVWVPSRLAAPWIVQDDPV
jgi:Z1 domain